MNKEQLRMQMLAGIITESQYKAKLEEEDSMGKIGKSYPAPGYDSDDDEDKEITLTPQQKKAWEDAMIETFYDIKDQFGKNSNLAEAVGNLITSAEKRLWDVLFEKEIWYDWSDSKLDTAFKEKGITKDEVKKLSYELYDEFVKGPAKNKKHKQIQYWYEAGQEW